MNPFRAAARFHRLRSSWLGEGGQPVARPLAQARAAICATCPLNQPHTLWELLAAPAIATVTRQLQMKDELGLKLEGEEQLHVCEACGCVLSLKVWVPLRHIMETTDYDKLHPKCWILSE